MPIALYPGSFDPVTNGHLDIALRASRIFDKLVIGVYDLPMGKHLLFSTEERVELVKQSVKEYPNIEAVGFHGLTVDFAKKIGAKVIVRGLRMSADFENEFDMAMMNRNLAPDLELVCLMATLRYQFLSSSLMKEVASLNGNVDNLVPPVVSSALKKKLKREIS